MIEFMAESERNVVGVKATGMLRDIDYREVLIPGLEKLFDEHGKLRVLFYMDDSFDGWDLEAAWDDATFGLSVRPETL